VELFKENRLRSARRSEKRFADQTRKRWVFSQGKQPVGHDKDKTPRMTPTKKRTEATQPFKSRKKKRKKVVWDLEEGRGLGVALGKKGLCGRHKG